MYCSAFRRSVLWTKPTGCGCRRTSFSSNPRKKCALRFPTTRTPLPTPAKSRTSAMFRSPSACGVCPPSPRRTEWTTKPTFASSATRGLRESIRTRTMRSAPGSTMSSRSYRTWALSTTFSSYGISSTSQSPTASWSARAEAAAQAASRSTVWTSRTSTPSAIICCSSGF
ncbi:unknown [Clostridium sp. CAG:1024]|nr:unknown [Clostridium sp. CAG:1024]